MEAVFLKLLNMSIVASWLILAVILLRFFLKKTPKWIMCVLWALVAVRLICPTSLESITSLIPSAEVIQEDILYSDEPSIATGVSYLNSMVNPVIKESLAPNPGDSMNPLQVWTTIAAYIWAAGVIILLCYAAISYFRLKRKVHTAVRLEENVWQSEHVSSPFILGIVRPHIYLPFHLDEEQKEYVVAHERAHLARRDHWWKLAAYLLVAVYWFNPLCWIAYCLLCKDIELACDEKVVKDFDLHHKKMYSQTLVSCSVNRHSVAVCPLAFGENDVKKRVRNVLSYKRPAFWILAASIVICVVIAVCFLTNPKSEQENQAESGLEKTEGEITAEKVPEDYTLEDALAEDLVIIADGDVMNGQEKWEAFVETTSKGEPASIKVVHYFTLGDKSLYDEAFYESIKDEYPQLFVFYLGYNGEKYTVAHYEGDQLYMKSYKYLMRYEGEPVPSATFSRYVRYVLIDDNTVTWDDIWRGLLSSQSNAAIDHTCIYDDLEYE